jgi:hypothetical protein
MKSLVLAILIVALVVSLGGALRMGKFPPVSLSDRKRFLCGMAAVLLGALAVWLITVLYPTS